MYREWPHFRSAIGSLRDGARQDRRPDRRRIRSAARSRAAPADRRGAAGQRLARAIAACSRSPAHRELLEENPVLRRSIDVRNPYVDPINLVQIELLRRLRSGDADPRSRSRVHGDGQRHRRGDAEYRLMIGGHARWCNRRYYARDRQEVSPDRAGASGAIGTGAGGRRRARGRQGGVAGASAPDPSLYGNVVETTLRVLDRTGWRG